MTTSAAAAAATTTNDPEDAYTNLPFTERKHLLSYARERFPVIDVATSPLDLQRAIEKADRSLTPAYCPFGDAAHCWAVILVFLEVLETVRIAAGFVDTVNAEGATGPHNTWPTFRDGLIAAIRPQSHIRYLLEQYRSLRRTTNDITAYGQSFRAAARDANVPVDDPQTIAQFIESLDHPVLTLRVRHSDPTTLTDAIHRATDALAVIIAEDSTRMKSTPRYDRQSSSFSYPRQPRDGPFRPQTRAPFQQRPPTGPRDAYDRGRNPADRVCYNCNRPGHISRNCSQPRQQGNGGARPAALQ